MEKILHRTKAVGFLLFAAIVFLASSCSHKMGFQPSSVVPAADGTVRVKKDDNNNYRVEVKITHLAPANKLQPPHQTYVVWTETEQSGVKNLGQLNSTSGLLTSTLKAELNALTPYKPTRLFITAEDDPRANYPSSLVVLSTDRLN